MVVLSFGCRAQTECGSKSSHPRRIVRATFRFAKPLPTVIVSATIGVPVCPPVRKAADFPRAKSDVLNLAFCNRFSDKYEFDLSPLFRLNSVFPHPPFRHPRGGTAPADCAAARNSY